MGTQRSGGAIVVTGKDSGDTQTIAQIRSHFRAIAQSFGKGLFDKPVATHGEVPPGSALMAAKKAGISYRYEERSDDLSENMLLHALSLVLDYTSKSLPGSASSDFLEFIVPSTRWRRQCAI